MNFTLYSIIFLFISMFAASPTSTHAQSPGSPAYFELKFEKGVSVNRGMVQPTHPCPKNGRTECGNENYTNYTLKAAKGDRFRFTLTSETGGAIFSIFTPGRGEPLKDGGAITTWTGTFTESGDYPLTVYTFKSFTHYKLKVTKLN